MRAIKNKVRIHIAVLAMFLLIAAFTVPAFASTVYLVESDVGNGSTVLWYPTSNSSGWSVTTGTSVKLYIKLDSAESNVVYGLQNNSTSTKTQFGSFSDTTSSTTTKTINTAAYYKVYVTNNSASTITVQDSSYISF